MWSFVRLLVQIFTGRTINKSAWMRVQINTVAGYMQIENRKGTFQIFAVELGVIFFLIPAFVLRGSILASHYVHLQRID